ncbi:MAG: gliding motility-associated C-terminal domain-containing protein, partial [Brevinema sp.]
MKKNYIFLYFLCLIFHPRSFYFSQIKAGSQLWYSGFNAGVSSQGFGGVASKDSAFFSSVNPATAATINNFRVFSSGSIESPNFSAVLGIASPIITGGTLYASTEYLQYDQTTLTRIGYGKKVRSDLSFGMEGILNFHNDPLKFYLGGGFTLGVLWLPPDFIPIKDGWGFSNFSFGTKLNIVFFPIAGISENPAPQFVFQNGIEATFMDFGNAKWKFITDFAIGFVPLPRKNDVHLLTWLSLATSFTFWNIWDISVGTLLGNHQLGFGSNNILPFTFSTALGYEWDTFSFKVRYNLGADLFFNELEYRHTVGMELGFGQNNKKNIKAILSVQNNKNLTNYFSPNADLLEDTVTLLPSIIEAKNVNAWRINIENKSGYTVKTFEGNNKKIDSEYYIINFLEAYFVPTKSTIIPEKIIWDGKDNKDKIVPDGTYIATLQLRYNEDQITTSQSNIIIVDTEAPTAKITPSVKTLYLGDDPRQRLIFEQELSKDPWSVKLIDQADQSSLAEWVWAAGKAPLTNIWELKNPLRVNVASGYYSYIACSLDKSGNMAKVVVSNIGIETKPRKPTITSDFKSFSPNHDDEFDFVKIFPGDNARIGLVSSKILVYNSAGDIVRSTNINISNIPSLLVWDGKDSSEKKLDDGSYFFILENTFDDKEVFHSNPLIIELDNSAPNFTLDYSPKRFSPDKDSINDNLKLFLKANDVTGIGHWSIALRNNDGETLKEFTGDQAEKSFSWIPEKDSISSGDIIYID